MELPRHARGNGTRIRWWQPRHSGVLKDDWAVDNVVIGGMVENPGVLLDNFEGTDGSGGHNWLSVDNMRIGSYCGSTSALVRSARASESATLTSIDLKVDQGHILQFNISIGCNTSLDNFIAPVRLEYSFDFGMTWRPLVLECLPSFPECHGIASTGSFYYADKSWTRVTIPLEGLAISKYVHIVLLSTLLEYLYSIHNITRLICGRGKPEMVMWSYSLDNHNNNNNNNNNNDNSNNNDNNTDYNNTNGSNNNNNNSNNY